VLVQSLEGTFLATKEQADWRFNDKQNVLEAVGLVSKYGTTYTWNGALNLMPYLEQGTLKYAAHRFVATLLGLRKRISVLGVVCSMNLASDSAKKQVYDISNSLKNGWCLQQGKRWQKYLCKAACGLSSAN
jgi:hypothetical protein